MKDIFRVRRMWRPRASLKRRYEVVVVGGGSHGLATAYYLAKRHGIRDVCVLERSYIGSGASGRNTTIIRANYRTPEGAEFYRESVKLYERLSTALDFKDNETGGHSQRVVAYTLEVSRQLGVSGADLDVIGQGALLHDIGKIAVPDRVLLKPGKLSDEEWMIMRKHPETGYQMLKTIQIPEPIATIVRHHHERFDGAGYPLGLRGNQIAQGARIFAVADLYDAHGPFTGVELVRPQATLDPLQQEDYLELTARPRWP